MRNAILNSPIPLIAEGTQKEKPLSAIRWEDFFGPNAGYVLELYEHYRQSPESVDSTAREFFDRNPLPPGIFERSTSSSSAPSAFLPGSDLSKIAGALRLAEAIRVYGHFAAALDPLGSSPPDDPALHLETYRLNEAELRVIPAGVIGGVAGQRSATAWQALEYLRSVYSGTVGHDYLQIRNAEERAWLREAAESGRFSVTQNPIEPLDMLRRLTQVEVFEHFLQRSFAAKTRFSIEGLDVLIPLLDVVIGLAAEAGIFNILIGMAHRGRLNILAHILNKPVDQILAEFKDPLLRRVLQNEPDGWSGDVKYHAGARRVMDSDQDQETIQLTIQMAPNPSHLEAVNPVVEGMARAAGTRAGQPGAVVFNPAVTLPVVIHGDAAFPGQGVVAETLNMYRLPGYETGGTIHVIANNQIGFTTGPGGSRSTLFASDLAKGYRIPIIHINADDPQGAIMAARIACAYRERFHNDFLIDLIGYRRLGHNEGDEPAFTQPLMYKRIEAHPSVRKLWAEHLVESGLIPAELPDHLVNEQMNAFQAALEKLDPDTLQEPIPRPPPPGAARKVRTSIPFDQLQNLNRELLRLPEGFHPHPRLARIRQRRDQIFDQPDWPAVDWAAAEDLALASILAGGIPIRLTGQDSERGTFSHRHAVLHDVESGAEYIPLQALPQARAAFEIRNSPLSEYAALGFEFGFNVQSPNHLVIWEAQYGDFVNNAQTVIDEFILSARDKWGQLPSLVMLLPHGYEGQGPDHSSGRLERFLNLAVDNNLRVANCTTAANYFHLLRRQALLLSIDPLPLVVMTPKSLLRHPLVSSPPRAFSEGGWQAVIDRSGPPQQPGKVTDHPLPPAGSIRRLILCSGKIFVDLLTSENQPQHPEVAIARIEQLAPFPLVDVQELLSRYPALDEVVWVQEEPQNMGAWEFCRPHILKALAERVPLSVIARPPSASPAEGSNNLYTFNQHRLIERAFLKEEGGSRPFPSIKSPQVSLPKAVKKGKSYGR